MPGAPFSSQFAVLLPAPPHRRPGRSAPSAASLRHCMVLYSVLTTTWVVHGILYRCCYIGFHGWSCVVLCEVVCVTRKKNSVKSRTVTPCRSRSRTGWRPPSLGHWRTTEVVHQVPCGSPDLKLFTRSLTNVRRCSPWSHVVHQVVHQVPGGLPGCWPGLTLLTRSLTNVRRRDERLRFRSVANAIRAGIVVDRWEICIVLYHIISYHIMSMMSYIVISIIISS